MTTAILHAASKGSFASCSLTSQNVYTRDDLRQLFDITASSINNGIFKPAHLDSVWIFVTETKTADRTQYNDIFTGDVLRMEGQLKGGTDHLLREHVSRGLELLVFYRKKKYEHAGAGFTYEGRFLYQESEGSEPTKFILHRDSGRADALSAIEAELETRGEFDPNDVTDARRRTLANVVRRQGQHRFRQALIKAYEGRCAVTGCTVQALLEAAHILPYKGAGTNVVSNGLLLRADIHTLFDLGLLWIEPQSFQVRIADLLKSSEYGDLEDRPITLPKAASDRPSSLALKANSPTSLSTSS